MDIYQFERQFDPVKDNPVALLRKAHEVFCENLAVLSSFGAESALLLAMLAEVKKDICVLFLDTGKHFDETLVYKKKLIEILGLTNIVDVIPEKQDIDYYDPTGELWAFEDIQKEMVRRDLPPHPLVNQGYLSIGCKPCTRPVQAGEETRCGRWSGLSKTECGIHL